MDELLWCGPNCACIFSQHLLTAAVLATLGTILSVHVSMPTVHHPGFSAHPEITHCTSSANCCVPSTLGLRPTLGVPSTLRVLSTLGVLSIPGLQPTLGVPSTLGVRLCDLSSCSSSAFLPYLVVSL